MYTFHNIKSIHIDKEIYNFLDIIKNDAPKEFPYSEYTNGYWCDYVLFSRQKGNTYNINSCSNQSNFSKLADYSPQLKRLILDNFNINF